MAQHTTLSKQMVLLLLNLKVDVNMKTLGKTEGTLITVDIEVESFNEQYGVQYDGYILTPQTAKNTVSTLYGFTGFPSDDANLDRVAVYYR